MKRLIHGIGLVCFMLCPGMLSAQKYLEKVIPYQNRVVLSGSSGRIEAGLLPDDEQTPKAKPSLWYSWYAKDSIRQTQGGYSGRLLHGDYLEMYADRQLKVKGCFVDGLRDGSWSYWDVNGTLRKSSTWNGGRETGTFRSYDEKGVLQREGRLKDGMEVIPGKRRWWQVWRRPAKGVK